MTAGLTARTRVIALLGNPVDHSLSPIFQNAAIRHLELDAVYVALRCDAARVLGLLRGIAESGGGGNVTVPHKGAAWDAVEQRTAAAQRTRACNTFWHENGRTWGDNTDVAGFAAAAASLLGRPLHGLRVVVAGAGGSARSVLSALIDGGVREIQVVARTPERAATLSELFNHPPALHFVEATASGEFDLAVNATPLGLRKGDPFPFPPGLAASAALDLVYGAGGTPWVRQMRGEGIPAADGAEMLLHQGAAAFERWFGLPAPLNVMRRALEGAR